MAEIDMREIDNAMQTLMAQFDLTAKSYCIDIVLWQFDKRSASKGRREFSIKLTAFDAQNQVRQATSADWQIALHELRGQLSPRFEEYHGEPLKVIVPDVEEVKGEKQDG